MQRVSRVALQLRAPCRRFSATAATASVLQQGSAQAGPAPWQLFNEKPAVPPLVLLLDLDETLLRPKVEHVHKYDVATVDATVNVPVNGGMQCDLSFRPGLGAFFDWIRERQSAGLIEGPWLFVQGMDVYVDTVLAAVDPHKEIFSNRVLSRNACTPTKTPWVMKDFSKVPCSDGGGASNVHRMVLVDNNTMSCMLHPSNTLMVRDWQGNGAPDAELERVSSVLDAVIEQVHKDVAQGAPVDYARHLVQTMPRHLEFQRRVHALRARLNDTPPLGKSVRELRKELWQEACGAKRHLLGLAAGEV